MTDTKTVPCEPTFEMIEAYFETCRRFGFHAHINATAAWQAMLAAAPAHQPDRQGAGEPVRWIATDAHGFETLYSDPKRAECDLDAVAITPLYAALPPPADTAMREGDLDEPLKWFLKMIEAAGGAVSSSDTPHNPINLFCDDRGDGDDTFNLSEAHGYTITSHDTSFDASTTRLTDKGRAALATLSRRDAAEGRG